MNCLTFTETSDLHLGRRAHLLRLNSVSDATIKSRQMQWNCYLRACVMFDWTPFPCGVDQACKYVTYLSDRLKFSSILAYYQAVIFYHTCEGLEPVRVSNPVLKATLNGIKRLRPSKEVGKDPMFPHHLERIVVVVNFDVELELLVFVAALLMFRSLLRVSHIICSEHTLLRSDVQFNSGGFLLRVRSSKTVRRGEGVNYIPVTKVENKKICAARWLKKLTKLYPGAPGAPLFSSVNVKSLTYSSFSKTFKRLIERAGLVGDFASHSLRGGGATFMSMVGCSIDEIKSRGQWVSDCVNRYIRHPLSHKLKVDEIVAKNVS